MKNMYDANGNTIERIIYTIQEKSKPRLNMILKSSSKTTGDGKVTEYLYDNVGNRFIKKDRRDYSLPETRTDWVAMDIEMTMGGTEDMERSIGMCYLEICWQEDNTDC